MASVEKIHYGSHEAIIGSLAAVMTGKMPMRTQSRKDTTKQIEVETADLDEMAKPAACRMADGNSTGQSIFGKRSRSEASEADRDAEPAQKRRRAEAGIAKRDWENYYFSLPVSRRPRRWNLFKIWDPYRGKTRILKTLLLEQESYRSNSRFAVLGRWREVISDR